MIMIMIYLVSRRQRLKLESGQRCQTDGDLQQEQTHTNTSEMIDLQRVHDISRDRSRRLHPSFRALPSDRRYRSPAWKRAHCGAMAGVLSPLPMKNTSVTVMGAPCWDDKCTFVWTNSCPVLSISSEQVRIENKSPMTPTAVSSPET